MEADQVIQALARFNVAAGAAVLLVLLARRPVRSRFGARAAYALWLAAPAAGLAGFIPGRVASAASDPLPAIPNLDAATAWIASSADGAGRLPDLAPALVALWLAGAAAWAAWAVYRSWRLAADPALGPALVGVVRPRLVLPANFETRFDEAERRLILAHEAIHAAAHHPAINALVEAARCLNWFNPLVHLAAFYARVDQELACDAAVVARHPAERRTYARALLKSQLAPGFLPLGCQWPGRTRPLLTERIEMLTQPRISRARHLAGLAAIALLSAGAGYAAWAAQPPGQPQGIRAAIEAGDGLAVRKLGGTPADVVAALKVEYRARQPGGPAYAAQTLAELERFADTSGGASLAFVPFTGPDLRTPAGRSVGGAHWGIERRTPDGMVQYVLLMKDGKLFVGGPRPADPGPQGR